MDDNLPAVVLSSAEEESPFARLTSIGLVDEFGMAPQDLRQLGLDSGETGDVIIE